MRKLLFVCTAAVVCSCSKPAQLGGLIAEVKLGTAKASCIDVRVKSADGTELGAKQLPFEGRATLEVGIGSKDYPQDVLISVQPTWSPSGCTMAKPNGAAIEKPGKFPFGSVATVTFELVGPSATVDADGDGYVGVTSGGPDCNDGDPASFPGANEACLTLSDLDCDGLSGCADTSCTSVAGCAQPATQLQFTSAPYTVDTAMCSGALTVESRDGSAVAAALPGGTQVALAAAPPQGVTFYSDAACTLPVTSLSAAAPSSTFTFYFRAMMSGSIDVTASSGTLTPATQTQAVRPPGASQLAFATPARTVMSGACSMVLEVESRDGSGAPRAATTDIVAALSVAPAAAVEFYSDANCSSAVTGVTVATGQSKASLYVKGITAGAPVITASANGFTAATQAVTVTAGAPAKLSFVTSAQGIAVNVCSGAASVRAEDAQGNPATLAGPLALTLAATGVGGFTFYSDAACATATTMVSLAAAAGSVATFYFRGTNVGAAVVTVSGNMLPPAQQTENIGVGPPNRLAFTTAVHTVTAGACSPPVTVEVRDASNNPVNPPAPIAVSLEGTPTQGFTLYSDAACTVALPQPLMLMGSPSATFRFQAQKVATQRIDASAVSLMTASQVHAVSAAAASRLVISTPVMSVTAGDCSSPLHVDVLDAFQNPVSVTSLPVTYAATGTGFAFYGGAAGCGSGPTSPVTSTNGFDFRFIANVAGTLPITISSGSLMPAMQTQTVTAGAAALLAFTTNARSQVAGACSPSALTVQLRDLAGNPVSVAGATPVNLSASDGGITFYDQAGCGSGAQVTAISIAGNTSTQDFWFVGRRTGVSELRGQSPGLMGAFQNTTITPGTPAQLVITSPARSAQVNACSVDPLVVETRDTNGNPSVVSTNLTVSVDGGSSLQAFAGNTCAAAVPGITVASGASTGQFYVRGAAAGTFPVVVSATGFSSDSQSVTVTPGVTQVRFTTAAQTRQAGECSGAVTVESRDMAGSALTAGTAITVALTAATGFTYYSDSGCTNAVTQVNIAPGTSTASYYFRGVTGGAGMLAITSPGLTGDSQAVTIVPAVRRGVCTIASSTSVNSTCSVGAPALFAKDRTFLVFQTDPDGFNSNSADALARCHLVDASNIECRRGGSPGSNTPLVVYWQTVTLPTAATVQHLNNIACANNGVNQAVTINNVGSLTDTFLLHSIAATAGGIDDNEHYTSTLTGSTSVDLTHAGGACGQGDTHALQVVKLSGATVNRGTAQFNGNQSIAPIGLPALTQAQTMLSYSWRTTAIGDDVCERSVRGFTTSDTAIGFARGNGNGSGACTDDGTLNIAFERVQFPTGYSVQQVDVNINNPAVSATVTLPTAVDPTRTFVMTGSQTHSGQSLGETSMSGAQALSHFVGRFSLNAAGTQLTATRGTNNSDVRYTVFVVQVDPR